MATYRCCDKCGQRIPHKLWCYSCGDGALHFSWVEDCPKNGGNAANRTVTEADVRRYLRTKNGKRLVNENWIPFLADSVHWVLAKVVQRIGPNKVKVDGETYTYAIDQQNIFWKRDREVIDGALTLTFRYRLKGQRSTHECKNGSIRMVVRYFLNHEAKLKELYASKGSKETA